GKVRIRRVNAEGGVWRAAAALQTRLRPADLEGDALDRLAKAAKLDPAAAKARYGPLARP
ncbi:MAG TPA: 6-phosphofructokinase, partial [Candidatus Thermoplasmatota archaeon]|nr:6-phosphofructokinase [Candidatus Thermoplasmatota archaeon]